MEAEDQLHDVVSAAGALTKALKAVDPSELPAGTLEGLQALRGRSRDLIDAEMLAANTVYDAEQAVAGAAVHLMLEVLKPGVVLKPEALAAVEAFRVRIQQVGLAVA
jgi:hypothetical protein